MHNDKRLKSFINSKFFVTLIALILTFTLIFIISQVSFIFTPVRAFVNVLALPLILTLIFYYLTNPFMKYLIERGVNRNAAIFTIFLIILFVISVFFIWVIPVVRHQIVSLISEFPNYYETMQEGISTLLQNEYVQRFQEFFDQGIDGFIESFRGFATDFAANSVQQIGSTFGTIFSIGVGLITAPVMFFYLMKEDHKFLPYISKLFPTKARPTIRHLAADINKQLEAYIRGELIVAASVAIMFSVGYTIIGLPFGIALGVISGILNIVPFLGSMLAMIPALIIGVVHSPLMFVKVVIVAIMEQTLEGRIIAPKVLGDNLDIHPVTILLILLTAGQLYGLTGVIVGIPLYAMAKVIVKYLFSYFKQKTDLYPEAEELDDIIEGKSA